MSLDLFVGAAQSLLAAPATRAIAVTPNDAADLVKLPRALYVSGAGTLKVTCQGDTDAVTLTVPAGSFLPLRPKRVWATGTTSTGIVALY